MNLSKIASQGSARGSRMLRSAMGSAITAWLADPQVIEVMLNPDGRLWVGRVFQRLWRSVIDRAGPLSLSPLGA